MTAVNGTVEGFHFNGNITHICTASSAHLKCKTEHCTVILVDIMEGKIAVGETITVSINGKNVTDTVSRIEKSKQEVTFAQQGDGVGICLSKSDAKDFGISVA